ncbi:MAG TPA: hypothetical protein VE732_01885, partial [Nitrososphaera sp.]|nr:hypothetical protein [Nitrososphaera sp.]
MSLLAAQGIGIFEDRHFVVTPGGKCEPIGKLGKKGGSDLKTHNVAWQALEYWAGLTRSADLFRNIVQPSGIPLGTWLDAFGAGSLSRPIGMRWLKTWGVDLKRLSKGVDRDARNQASYRPTYFDQGNALGVLDCSGFIRNLWRLLEPTQPSKFDAMDRHLLRLTLRQAFNALPKTRKYEDRVSAMLNTIFPDGVLVETWLRFLTGITEPEDPLLITEAASKSASNNPRYHLQILSRAALLLRVATGACLKLLRSGPSGHSELEFWWRPLGERHGIWEPGEELFDLT